MLVVNIKWYNVLYKYMVLLWLLDSLKYIFNFKYILELIWFIKFPLTNPSASFAPTEWLELFTEICA